ncbi:AzlD domain-containing protein [Paenibacillaceae bacterium]|nr:AzlD domain-containing protein [Paenibacillaceae bacterium]
MEIRESILLIVLATALVTVIPRVLPLIVLSRFELPDWAMRWLSFVPISVMAALVGQELFVHEEQIVWFNGNLKLLAAVPTLIVALKTRSLLLTVIAGMGTLMVLRYFWG